MPEQPMDSLDVAYVLGVSTDKVYAMARNGEIPHTRPGRSYRFDPLEFRRWHREYKKLQPPSPSAPRIYTPSQIARLPFMGRVYFIQSVEGGPIKIGKADSPLARLAAIQACSPVKLRILATLPGGQRQEATLHRVFAESRLHGEWFEPTPDLLALIEDAKGDHRGTD